MNLYTAHITYCLKAVYNRQRSIYQYSNMVPRLSGQTSVVGVVFFVSKSLLGIEVQKKLEKFEILTRKPRRGASGCRYQFLFDLTRPPNPCMKCTMKLQIDHHTGNYVPYSFRINRLT